MTFGEAIEAMKAGGRVSRTGWTGWKTWVTLVESPPTSPYILFSMENPPSLRQVTTLQPWVDESPTPPDTVPWVATHADILGEDWFKL